MSFQFLRQKFDISMILMIKKLMNIVAFKQFWLLTNRNIMAFKQVKNKKKKNIMPFT